MEKISFNSGWICYPSDEKEELYKVHIPHDAMQLDTRSSKGHGEGNNCWYETRNYVYIKRFIAKEQWKPQKAILEFEGVYRKASVYINNKKLAFQENGFSGFYVEIEKELQYGKENELRVEVINSDQPNCRWYTGTGIYRPVWLYLCPQNHIELNGIRITTLDYRIPKVKVEVTTNQGGTVKAEIADGEQVLASTEGRTEGVFQWEAVIPNGKLWSAEHPALYTCRVFYEGDWQEETFGIRLISWDTKEGFCINGERVILRGACIHHDNGLLGARSYEFAERRKIRILKESGYNAVRSAHNPCSKAMLRACDELGMLVMDEYTDMWYIHKTKYDYASELEKNYKADLQQMVEKDYNHPSVILYSTGNEVSETAQKRGIQLCRHLTECLHKLDASRPVTCGINIFFNLLSSIGMGVYSDKKADSASKHVKKKRSVGSEFYNNMAGFFGADFMKLGASLYPCDVKTRGAFAQLDIAGYNYGCKRYAKDLKKYPQRLILGTETFCADAYEFWKIAKAEPRMIGDFVWAGMDYLGEVGIGAWEYKDYAPDFSHGVGWMAAGSGRIDLTGKPLAEMRYTKVVFGLEPIGIGVVPVKYAMEKHSPSAWKMSNAMESWSWNGCDGMKTRVEVYADAEQVSLFVNDRCVGTKKPHKCLARFRTIYESGEIKAVSYDKNGTKIAETSFVTAEEDTILTIEPEMNQIKKDRDLCYVRLKYTDRKGRLKPLERGDIEVSVEGGILLGLGSACPYHPRSYLGTITDTYYGEALAVIMPGEAEKITVYAKSRFGESKKEIGVDSYGSKKGEL